jgi:hypothetical protein
MCKWDIMGCMSHIVNIRLRLCVFMPQRNVEPRCPLELWVIIGIKLEGHGGYGSQLRLSRLGKRPCLSAGTTAGKARLNFITCLFRNL